MILGLLTAVTTNIATQMFLSGAAASITLLCVGTKVSKRK